MRALGEPAGVIQLLDRHERDCAAFARRLGVPHHVVPFEDVGPFEAMPVVRRSRWREVALWWPERRVLVCADALGTVPHYFALGGERLGVHPLLRLTPPRSSGGSSPSTSSAATARACTSRRPRRCATRWRTRGGERRGCSLELPAAAPAALTTIARVLSLFPDTRRRRGRRARRRRRPRRPTLAERVRHAARRLLRADDLRAAARAYREAAPDALAALQREGVPERRAPAPARRGGLRRRRLDARRARVRAARRASPASGSSSTGTTRATRSCAAAAEADAALRRARRARRGRARGGGRRAARARARHARDRGGHARDDPHRATTARSSASRPTQALAGGRARARDAGLEAAGLHLHIGSQLARHRAARPRDGRLARRLRARRRAELGWAPTVVDLGGGLGIRYVEDERPPAIGEFVATLLAAARATPGPATPPAGDPRARPLARRAGRRHALPRRRRQAGERRRRPTSPSTAACPTTRARSSTARATAALLANRADEEPAGTLRRLRQALRVRRRADRAASRCPSRAAATCSPCPRPAPTRSRWARTTTPSRARRRCSSPTARRA